MTATYQRVLFVRIPLIVTDTLQSVWSDVPMLRLSDDKDLMGIPVGCYYGESGRNLYNALRATKSALYVEGSMLTAELNKAIAWARGIHCAHPRSPLEGEVTDQYYRTMTAATPAISI